MLGSLGFQEILLILGLALLIFGPRELPRIGRTIGRAMGEFRKASNELKRSLNTEMIEEEIRQNDPRKWVRETAKELEAAAMADDESTRAESTNTTPSSVDDSETVEPVSEDSPSEGSPSEGSPSEDSPSEDSAPTAEVVDEGMGTVPRNTKAGPST